MAECPDDELQEHYTGYEVSLFNRLAERMVSTFNDTNFALGQWEFVCVDWDTATLDLYKPADDPTRVCNISLGAIDATSGRLLQGAQFSAPTYPGSLQILVLNPPAKIDRWAFLAPFKAELWVALFGTSAAVAVSIWLQEISWTKILSHPMPALRKLSNIQWASMALLVQILAEFSARRTGARITILGYGFLVLIALNTYMAVLAARLTVNTIEKTVNGLDELANRPVGVFVDYEEDIKLHTPLLNLVPMEWSTLEDEEEMLRRLRAGEVAALLMDAPWVQYQAAKHCDLAIANEKQNIMPFNYGFGFPVDFPRDALSSVNMALAQLMEEGVINALQNQYIKPAAACPSNSAQADLASVQLGFGQVSGLWIFLAAAMAFGWGVDLAQVLFSCWQRRKRQHAISPAHDDDDTMFETSSMRPSDFGRAISGTEDVEVAGKAPLKTAPSDMQGDRAISARSVSGGSLWSLSSRLPGRSKSFFQLPEVADSWMAVSEASTVDEMVELLDLQVRHLDSRLRKALPALERRIERSQQAVLAALEEAVAQVRGGARAGGGGGVNGGGGADGGGGSSDLLCDGADAEGGRQLLRALTTGRHTRMAGGEGNGGGDGGAKASGGSGGGGDGAGSGECYVGPDCVVPLQAHMQESCELRGRPEGQRRSGPGFSATVRGGPAAAAHHAPGHLERGVSRVHFGDVSGGKTGSGNLSPSLPPVDEAVVLPGSFVRRAAVPPAAAAGGGAAAAAKADGVRPGSGSRPSA